MFLQNPERCPTSAGRGVRRVLRSQNRNPQSSVPCACPCVHVTEHNPARSPSGHPLQSALPRALTITLQRERRVLALVGLLSGCGVGHRRSAGVERPPRRSAPGLASSWAARGCCKFGLMAACLCPDPMPVVDSSAFAFFSPPSVPFSAISFMISSLRSLGRGAG